MMDKIDKDLIDPKKEPASEKAHLVTGALLSCVPGVGGVAEKLFNKALKSPAKRRQEEWMLTVTEAINEILEAKKSTVDLLLKNEKFVDTFIQATLSAIKNHDKEKLALLKNAVINSAISDFDIPQKESVFLQIIDSFTVWHFKALNFYHDPMQFVTTRSYEGEKSEGMLFYLRQAIPQLSDERDFLRLIWADLQGKELIGGNSISEIAFIPPEVAKGPITHLAKRTTRLGEDLIKFISN